MTDAIVFAGPTLPPAVLAERFGVKADGVLTLPNDKRITFLPPVSEGDIFELVARKPSIIAIVDGYFENVPAVWHKEILFAMSQGIHVLGASSMGALRASELAVFGMEGIGSIYKAYAEERWQDDDEVTVVHGPGDLGYPAMSEAMANIRHTLDAASQEGVLSAQEWMLLTSLAKNLHYKERGYKKILDAARLVGMERERLDLFEKWLVTGRRDQKRADALDLMGVLIRRLEQPFEKKKVLYHFENTIIWQKARRACPSQETDGR